MDGCISPYSTSTVARGDSRENERDILSKYKDGSGIITQRHTINEVHDLKQRAIMYKQILEVKSDYQKKCLAFENQKEKADLEYGRQKDMENELAQNEEALQQIESGEIVVLPREQWKIEKKIEYLRKQIPVQHALAEKEKELRVVASQARDMAELAYHKLKDDEIAIEQSIAQENAEKEIIAAARMKKKEIIENTREKRYEEYIDNERQEEELLETQAQRQKRIALEGMKLAKERLRDYKQEQLPYINTLKQAEDEYTELRTLQKQSLDSNVERITNRIKGKNEKNRIAEEEKKKKEKEEFNDLLSNGKNPYYVFRKEKLDKEKQQKIENLEKKIADSKVKIKERVEYEDSLDMKAKKIEIKNKEYEDKFRRELGRKAQEEHRDEIMKSMTINQSILATEDGSPFYPSEKTQFKPGGFGSGRTALLRPDIVDKIASKPVNKNVEPADIFVNTNLRSKDFSKQPSRATSSESAYRDIKLGEMPGTTELETIKSPEKTGFKLRELSKYEQNMMKKALDRHKAGFTKPQVVCGREFKGQAFIPKPATVEFKDFEVGVDMVTTFILTNVSYSQTYFKMLPIVDEYINYFEIEYNKPGRMSAGTSCLIKIRFMPKVNEDIYTEIPFLADTGPFAVPLVCLTKKATMSISSDHIDFKPVVLGEYGLYNLKITNDGALDTHYTLVTQNPEEIDNQIFEYPIEGDILKHSTKTITFKFTPNQPESYERDMKLEFNNTEPFDLTMTAECVKVPIYLENPILDFLCIPADKTYRIGLFIRNRGNITMKVNIKIPKDLKDYVTVNPDTVYVQGKDIKADKEGRSEVRVKFEPTLDLLYKFPYYVQDDVLEYPIQLDIPDQTEPVIFKIKAQITNSDIEINPNPLSFGRVYTNQSSVIKITMKNHSALAQRFGFIHLPQEVMIRPNYGFGTILPFESLEREIVFSPLSDILYEYKLECCTDFNRRFYIPMTAQGVISPFTLSHTIVHFPPTAKGDISQTTITIKNKSKKEMDFEFNVPVPDISQIIFVPAIGTIPPGNSQNILINFKPTEDGLPPPPPPPPEPEPVEQEEEEEDNKKGKKGKKSPAKKPPAKKPSPRTSKKKNGKKGSPEPIEQPPEPVEPIKPAEPETPKPPERPKVDDKVGYIQYSEDIDENEPWSRHAYWRVPLFMKEHNSDNIKEYEPLGVKVYTTTVQKTLTCDLEVIDFGKKAAGCESTKIITLVNTDEEHDLQLEIVPLNTMGSFSVLNPVKSIPADGKIYITICFKPLQHLIYKETLTIKSLRGNVNIKLTGEGISPSLEIIPNDPIINMGVTQHGNTSTKTITLKNVSLFPLTFTVKPLTSQDTNYTTLPVYGCIPMEGVILPEQSDTITFFFTADHSKNIPYRVKYLIDVPNQTEPHVIELIGRCYDTPLYIYSPNSEEIIPHGKEGVEYLLDIPSWIPMVNDEDNSNNNPLFQPTAEEEEPPQVNLNSRDTSIYLHAVRIVFPKDQPDAKIPIYLGGVQPHIPISKDAGLAADGVIDPKSAAAAAAAGGKGGKGAKAKPPAKSKPPAAAKGGKGNKSKKGGAGATTASEEPIEFNIIPVCTTGGVGTYDINIPSQCPFNLTNPRGNLTSTQEVVIEVTQNHAIFKNDDSEKDIGLSIGKWITTELVCEMKSGNDSFSVPIILKGFFNTI